MFTNPVASFLTTVALAGACLVTGNAANAADGCATTSTGYTICTIDRGHSGSDAIGVWNQYDQKVAQMSVVCTGNGGNRWTARSSESRATMQALANWWCRNY